MAVVFDTYEQVGGGYFQSLNTAKLINKLKIENLEIEYVTMLPNTDKELVKDNIKTISFKKLKLSRLHFYLSQSRIIDFFLTKLKIKNPFSVFLKENKFDIVFFLGPSFYINCCNEINFIVNLFDLNYKFNNYFPEYKKENIFNNTNALVTKSVNRAFKILVDTNRTKDELSRYLNCLEEKIEIYPFTSHLPNLLTQIKESFDPKKILDNINIKQNEKYIFYPAQFWAHKNHRYILDAIAQLKEKKILNFKTIFCGSDRGNLNFIKKIIKKNNLEDNVLIYSYLKNEEILALYSRSMALVMPSYVARSTLPLYEAFFLKVPVFYSKNVLDNKLEDLVFPINLNDPSDLANKLENYKNLESEMKIKIENSKKYFLDNCTDEKKKEILQKIFDEYNYISKRWKDN